MTIIKWHFFKLGGIMKRKTRKTFLTIGCTALLVFSALCALTQNADAADAVIVGMGQSLNADKAAAMREAADSAQKTIGTTSVKVILAWVKSGDESAFSELTAKFSSAKIYGFPMNHVFNTYGRDKEAVVIAFGGQINAAHSVKTLSNPDDALSYRPIGAQIANDLSAVSTNTNDSKLIILAGRCDNPKDTGLTNGVLSVMGSNAWVVGGSTGASFSNNTLNNNTSVLGILLYGAFDCRFGFDGTWTDLPVAAQNALNNANDNSKKPTLSLIFDCEGRYEKLSGLTGEMSAFITMLGATTPFVGGYLAGEIGKKDLNSAAYGSGGAFSVANIYSRQAATSVKFSNEPTSATRLQSDKTSDGATKFYRINGAIAKSAGRQSFGILVSRNSASLVSSGKELIAK